MDNSEKSLIARFRERWLEASGEYIGVKQGCNLAADLIDFLKLNELNRVVVGGSPLTPELGEALAVVVEVLADFGRDKYEHKEVRDVCAKARAGITGADALIAETGTLVIASRGRGDRILSALPPVHLVIAHEIPVFRDLEGFMKHAPESLSLTLITGPSRTADIEKKLVLGAHGPKRVVIWGPEPV